MSGPLMLAYADRVGADFVKLDWPGHPAWPMSAKFAMPTTLDHYERIAYVDADVLLRPSAVNLFDLCAPGQFGAHDELPYSRLHPQYKQEERYQRFRADMRFAPVPNLPWYVNAGVMIVPKAAAKYLLPPAVPMPKNHESEQDLTNSRLLDAARAGELTVRVIDRIGISQNWTDPGFKAAPPDAVLHFSGGGEMRRRRLADMRAWRD